MQNQGRKDYIPTKATVPITGQTCFLFLGGGLGIAAEEDGLAKSLKKLLLRSQKAWHQEIKERPQLQDIVLGGKVFTVTVHWYVIFCIGSTAGGEDGLEPLLN